MEVLTRQEIITLLIFHHVLEITKVNEKIPPILLVLIFLVLIKLQFFIQLFLKLLIIFILLWQFKRVFILPTLLAIIKLVAKFFMPTKVLAKFTFIFIFITQVLVK